MKLPFLKLGLKPLPHDSRDFQFAKFRTAAPLPKRPKTFGHENLIKAWGMLGNDQVGDCVLAGAGHEHMIWNAAAGKPVPKFTDECIISDYSAITGYNPNDPNSDQGTDMRAAAKYRMKTGIIDAAGVRHKIGAYVFIDSSNLDHILEAAYLFGAVALGVDMPQSAMDQFNSGLPWSVVKNSPIEGGHYVPLVANRVDPTIVTWAQLQRVKTAFLKKYCNTAVAYITEEYLAAGKSPEGFDLAALQSHLNSL